MLLDANELREKLETALDEMTARADAAQAEVERLRAEIEALNKR